MAEREPLRELPEARQRQEGDEKLVLRRREADWTGQERSSEQDKGFAVQRAAVDVAAAALAAHDGFTAGHADDVVTLCGALVERLGLSEPQRARVLAAARLHDLGKLAVPQAVLDKPGPLDPAEWALIRDHTLCGQHILQSVPELSDVGHIVRHSHERWDGGGYPDGLAGEEIPLESRIVFCADAFHAIRCDRPYRRGRSAAMALEEVRRHSGTQFDPMVVEALEEEANLLRSSPSVRLAAMTSTVRSKRLVVLLLSLVVSGSALAAPGGPLGQGSGGPEAVASTPAGCADPCVRESLGALAASQGAAAAPADHPDRGDASEHRRAGRGSRAAERAVGPGPASSEAGELPDRGERRPVPPTPASAPLAHQPPPAAPAPRPTGAQRRAVTARMPARAERPEFEEISREAAPPEPSREHEPGEGQPTRGASESASGHPNAPAMTPQSEARGACWSMPLGMPGS